MRLRNRGRVEAHPTLHGRRVVLRPLVESDFKAWREVRRRNADWLTKWEPRRPAGSPNPVEDRSAFARIIAFLKD